jgi:putative tricarboxylic transport membrane protein
MEDLFANLQQGFGVALTIKNLLFCFFGAVLGTLIGVLPGIGPIATIAMLLPATFTLGSPVTALIMLAGIYYGAQYGGSTTAILVNLPGETSSVVTAIDGYQLARKGKAGTALGLAAIGSFVGGTIGTFVLAALAPTMVAIALKFGPAENFSLMVLGLTVAIVLASGSVIKAIAMIILGLLLGIVGTDVMTGAPRFNMGLPELADGIGFVVVAMGIFGFGEIIKNLEKVEKREAFTSSVGSVLPSMTDLKASIGAMLRGTGLGVVLGVLPGGGPALAAFGAYSVEKKVSKTPEQFGKGAVQGVAAPESANNAAAQTSFIPLLTLGIPSNPVMALMMGAMIIQGIQPGPQVMTSNPDLFWGMIASMWIGNLILVILNLPLIGVWVKLLTIDYKYLYPAILVFCCIGVYSVSNNVFDVYITAFFGLLGYAFIKLDCEPAPLLMGFVLGPQMEEHLRRALRINQGDATVFFTKPISAVLLVLSILTLIAVLTPALRKTREEAFKED